MLPTQVQVNRPFGSGEEVKNRFSRRPPWLPSWMSNRNDFTFFLIYKSPWCFLPSFKSTSLSVQEKKWKIDFQDGHHLGHLAFPVGIILAIFDLQVTLMTPTKFQINWLILLEFNDTSTLMGHFVSSPRGREKRDRKDMEEMKERDREKKGTGVKVQ